MTDTGIVISNAAHQRFTELAAAEGLSLRLYLEELADTLSMSAARSVPREGKADATVHTRRRGNTTPDVQLDRRLVQLGITEGTDEYLASAPLTEGSSRLDGS